MLNEEIQHHLQTAFPSLSFEEGTEWPTMKVDTSDWLSLAHHVRHEQILHFNYLFCLTCIDWKSHLTMVYHLSSTTHRHNIVIKIQVDATTPTVESVSSIWRTAEFHEREVYEMFGVHFLHHPDLRLLILPDGWEGKNPLRKDFEDPINMIKL
jgi:NADH-quinone oxidoreductase subunit C